MQVRIFWLIIILIVQAPLQGQEYRALNGSAYAGSISVTSNPASIVRLPYSWDFSPVAMQVKYATNAIHVLGASYLSKWKNADVDVRLKNGNFRRYAFANMDIRLLGTRIRLNEHSAIAFGITGRTYLSIKSSVINGQDSLGSLREFLGVNQHNMPLSGNARASAWMGYEGTYARTVKFINNAQLNAGITLSLNRSLAGGFINASDFSVLPGSVNNQPGYYLADGYLDYGYSGNLDGLDTVLTFLSGWKSFFKNTHYALGLSLGAEYIMPGYYNDESDVDFKIGVSLLDIGKSTFQYSTYSRTGRYNQPNISDSLVEQKFSELIDAESLADSLQTIAGTINPLTGIFSIKPPTRLVINADKRVAENFFIHADVSIPLSATASKKKMNVQDMNLANLTFRYETDHFGFYLPVSLNNQMHGWVGGAVRAGPLLLGVHNWATIISKSKIQTGGMYLALIFRFGNKVNEEKGSGCLPADRYVPAMGNRNLKRLACPTNVH